MDSATDKAAVELVTPHRFTLEKYHRLIEAGLLGEEDRVELLEGVIAEMSPQDPPHAYALSQLNTLLVRRLDERAWRVRIQLPLTLVGDSEPEPDLAVVPRLEELRAPWHPAHAALVIEVADSPMRKDRLLKTRIYARSHIPEYWILDVEHRRITRFSDPDAHGRRYRKEELFEHEQTLRSLQLPEIELPLSSLFRDVQAR